MRRRLPGGWGYPLLRMIGVVLVALVPFAASLPAAGQPAGSTFLAETSTAQSAGSAPTGYQRVVDITFPVSGPARYSDDYHAMRGGGTRRHQATDVFAEKLQHIHAAASGQVCVISGVDEPEPYYGYSITVCADDGLRYRYIHINNDNPGTDDGDGGVRWAYAPTVRLGSRVTRGQWIAYVGDSGNAEGVSPHLHFEIIDADLSDPRLDRSPYMGDRINPYNSLDDARRRGDIPRKPAD